ncbi:amidase [Seohaeicola zhoushanensis]|uniref:Indoleacetamide hydrolase n=1 Tax=Seohaeicola zhoushanensis TaxID=1569283 RepID=A0A8J3GUG6_9RHOB|nr:amidase [Seohaeicola zhoushanensis]GHF39711.1 indoleacetamide hydrolase [Seohaeicola zhoushanensis]
MTEIWKWSAVETAARVRAREVSVREVTQAALDRMAAVNPTINAIVEPVIEAMDVAEQMDADGVPENAGPLYGVPVTTKINIDQRGYASSNGIPDFAGTKMLDDSPVASNFRKAGAVIVGRSNTPEFSMRYYASNPAHGVTKNPWDARLTPGGSSGGAAAAVAAGIGAIAHGNDLAGSLRYPAHCCGVATIRPSFGRVPVFNSGEATERPALAQTISVSGPIARSIGDVRAGLKVMSARDSRDPFWTSAQDSGRLRDGALTIGVCADPFGTGLPPEAAEAMTKAVQALRDAGFGIREITPPGLEEVATLWSTLAIGETELMIGDKFRNYMSPAARALYEEWITHIDVPCDPETLLTAMRDRVTYQRKWAMMFDTIDLLLTPISLLPIFREGSDLEDPKLGYNQIRANRMMQVISLLGVPAVAMPTHLAEGVPAGIQLVGPMHDDWFLLDVAEKLETELGTLWQQLPPL